MTGRREMRPRPPAPCRGFRWIGQPFSSCDRCGRPAWEHEGMMRLREGVRLGGGSGPFGGDDDWELLPWGPGEAEAMRLRHGGAKPSGEAHPPGPALELSAAMAETRVYRELLEEVLGTFGKQAWTDGMYTSVSGRAYRKWLERAGMKKMPGGAVG